MKKVLLYFIFISLFGLLTACSSSSSDKEMASKSESSDANDTANYSEESRVEDKQELNNTSSEETPSTATTERMIIHKAMIRTNVKDLAKAQSNLEQKVKKYGGYIVESNVYKVDDETSSGTMVVRIPEEHFETFLTDAEEVASKVLERNVTGQDVTEQYVDLSSRVKSKRTVEERLLSFMKDAKKTEDLLKISSDLATVQEEIEVMVGQMNYLENQTSFSTIELNMHENRVIVPEIDGKELNTWEKTKKQLVSSTNGLLAVGSGIVVFFIGNLPVIVILGVIALVVYFFVYKRRKERK